jgi:YYY domain-containing protein
MAFTDILAAIRWWFVLLLLGTAVFPVAYHFLKPLPDRGYAFTKMLGLLLVSFFFWLLGSLGFLRNDLGGILVALAIVVGLSAWAVWRERAVGAISVSGWIKDNWQQILLTEVVFLVMFGLWVWVRAQNPAISATEKPMDFAFLNSMSRSAAMPPEDPWLAGFGISYYYFGYLMTSVIARLAFVPEYIAFNLGIAWLVAGTAVGAFGLVYNLVAVNGKRIMAIGLGLIAAVALSIAGNQQITMEVLYASHAGSPAFWEWLDVRDINTPPIPGAPARYEGGGWWWWRSSRPIHEYSLAGNPEEGLEPIVEFPGFSFILGDMHPHVMALPFAFLSLAVAMVWWLNSEQWAVNSEQVTVNRKRSRFRSQFTIHNSQFIIDWPFYIFTALILGGLSFLNTWDVLIHLFVVVGAFVLAKWRREGDWHWGLIGQGMVTAVILLVLAFILYLPFFLGFKSQAGAPFLLPMLMRPTRLVQYFVIFAMPLWAVTLLLLALAVRQRFRYWTKGVVTAVSLLIILFFATFFFSWIVAASADGAWRAASLASDLGVVLSPRIEGIVDPVWGITAVFGIAPAFFSSRIAYGALTLYLSGLVALIVMIWHEQLQRKDEREQGEIKQEELAEDEQSVASAKSVNEIPDQISNQPTSQSILPFALLLVLTAVLLTLGPEFVYLRDNFGQRLNTIFKFYYQAWVLYGIAALYGIGYLFHNWNKGVQRVVPSVAAGGYAIMLTFALLFPTYGVNSRMIEYRGSGEFNEREPATLNGLAYIQRYNPGEYEAMMWLRDNIDGSPVIVEAVGGQYSGYGRMAANTGIPTLLGWAGHEYQWRGADILEPGAREPVVSDIYSQPDWLLTASLLDSYGVSYVVVGNLERDTYGPQVNEKFAGNLDVVFQNESVTIYQWRN